jgi:hypothetical protein
MNVLPLIPLAGLFYLFCATSSRHPDAARIICVANDCQTYNLPNGAHFTVKYASFNKINRRLECAVFCELLNAGTGQDVLDRGTFMVKSSAGMSFDANPFYTSHMAGLLLKMDKHPDQYPVAPGSKSDYVFSWHGDTKLNGREYRDHLAADTISFFAKTGGAEQVLFKLVWAGTGHK